MWVIVVFGALIAIFSFLMIRDAIVYRNYAISDEYWLTGLVLVGFLATMIALILS